MKHQKGRERAVHDEVTLAMILKGCEREREREKERMQQWEWEWESTSRSWK